MVSSYLAPAISRAINSLHEQNLLRQRTAQMTGRTLGKRPVINSTDFDLTRSCAPFYAAERYAKVLI